MHRRTLIRWSLSLVALWRMVPLGARGRTRDLSVSGRVTLRAVAAAVLPSELADEELSHVVERFNGWLTGYRAGADMGFGYGILRRRATPEIDTTRYDAQLTALERVAGEERGASMATLPLDDRRAVIGGVLRALTVDRLPDRPDGRHVVVDLMAFYYRSSDANDLCYGAHIGRAQCRRLAGSSRRPAPLAGR